VLDDDDGQAWHAAAHGPSDGAFPRSELFRFDLHLSRPEAREERTAHASIQNNSGLPKDLASTLKQAERAARLAGGIPGDGAISSRCSAARALAARAQLPGKLPVIGFLNFTSAAGSVQRVRAFTRSPTFAEQR
jgi:hypothetical protein